MWALDGEHGLKTIVARAASGDVTWFLATVNRIAEILQVDGDPDPVDARRATAIGILAQPAHALQLLLDHADDPTGHLTTPTTPPNRRRSGSPRPTSRNYCPTSTSTAANFRRRRKKRRRRRRRPRRRTPRPPTTTQW